MNVFGFVCAIAVAAFLAVLGLFAPGPSALIVQAHACCMLLIAISYVPARKSQS